MDFSAGVPSINVKPKILIVDDQPIITEIIYEIFHENCDVYVATSGYQAIEKALSLKPDVILLDVIMPGIDGWDTCKLIREHPLISHIPIIFITGSLDEADEVKGFTYGAVDFIRKPINPIITRSRVSTHLEIKRQADLLREFAMVDPLTNIANRRRFENDLVSNWMQAKRIKEPLSLVLFDVDYFKRYNDTWGHQKGDECLKRVAQILAACVKRPLDTIARYGGEEFVMLLPSTDKNGAQKIVNDALKNLAALKIPHPGTSQGYATISAGIATTIPIYKSEPRELLEAADKALYAAKKAGRNCWQSYALAN